MAIRYTEEFRRDAVRIATTSGLMRPKVASDLGVGLGPWTVAISYPAIVCQPVANGCFGSLSDLRVLV